MEPNSITQARTQAPGRTAQFAPSHDAVHRAFSRIEWVNSLGMRLATFVAVPLGFGKLFQVMYVQQQAQLEGGSVPTFFTDSIQ